MSMLQLNKQTVVATSTAMFHTCRPQGGTTT